MIKYQLSEFSDSKHYASVIDDPVQLGIEHTHDYYELTLVQNGMCNHYVNGENVTLHIADLCLIRPTDVHRYDSLTRGFQLINIQIPATVIHSMFDYLGTGFEPERLIDVPLPPTTTISMQSFHSVCDSLRSLILYRNLLGDKADALFHITLLNIITTYFPLALVHTHTDVPMWLQWLVLEMSKPENSVEGLSAMLRLAGKSQEHICRSCRKYLGLSPTQLINGMRLNHAARLLVETAEPILDIAIEVGFDTLSHFYHSFHSAYGITPNQFRNKGDLSAVKARQLSNLLFSPLPKGQPARRR